jgi:hypothetical protein
MLGNICYISVPKLFPTRFLTTAYAILNLCAHIFAIGAPLAAELKDPYPFLIYLILLVILLFASTLITELEKAKAVDELVPPTDEIELAENNAGEARQAELES